MNKRLSLCISAEAWQAVEEVTNEATQNFDVGSISYSDVINEMILTSKVDIKTLQLKHTDLRRSLRSMAAKEDVDIDTIIKNLSELKQKIAKKTKNSQLVAEAGI